MKTKCFFFSLLILFLSFFSIAHASSVAGTVNFYLVNQSVFFFSINSTIASKPACNIANRYVVPLNADYGKAIKDQIINAKSNNLTITVVGLNTCNTWGDSEDVNYAFTSGSPSTNVTVSNQVTIANPTPTPTTPTSSNVCLDGSDYYSGSLDKNGNQIWNPISQSCSSKCTTIGSSPCTIADTTVSTTTSTITFQGCSAKSGVMNPNGTGACCKC